MSSEARHLQWALNAQTTERYEFHWRKALEYRRAKDELAAYQSRMELAGRMGQSYPRAGDNRGMAKRGYSREFTPKSDRRCRIELDRVPPTLYDAVVAKAKREGISVRALTLKLLKDWLST